MSHPGIFLIICGWGLIGVGLIFILFVEVRP